METKPRAAIVVKLKLEAMLDEYPDLSYLDQFENLSMPSYWKTIYRLTDERSIREIIFPSGR